MREVKFILPSVGDVTDKAHAWLTDQLVDNFGGYTATESIGSWRSPSGAMVHECGTTYVVAIEGRGALSQFPRFREIALQAGRMAEQEAVYIVGPTGDAEIVSLVDVGKELIRESARGEFKSEIHRPQVGDFWETGDGSKVYISNVSTVGLVAFVVHSAATRVADYVVGGDGRVSTLLPTPHPLDLKRFIGR